MSKHKSLILIPLLFIAVEFSSCLHEEAHSIMKRMAALGEEFEEFDMARVMLVEGQGLHKRRLVKRDLRDIRKSADSQESHDLQLHLSSGSKVSLSLRAAGIVDSDTKIAYLTSKGRFVRNAQDTDCYSHGSVSDSSGDGWAVASHCDGLFGFASTPGYEYFIHPIESERTKRDTEGDDYDVHVMKRRTRNKSTSKNAESETPNYSGDELTGGGGSSTGLGGTDEDRINAKGFVVELAVFSDAEYWQQLQTHYPGREDDFLLTRLAATQALYSDREKVGYDAQIKVKLLEYWITNPGNYTNDQVLGNNLHSFCLHTRHSYFYDIHLLNTGISQKDGPKVGLAYVRGACAQMRCMISLSLRLNHFVVYAHEMGHTFGLTHFTRCPRTMREVGGFMGGGAPLNFSPCMKYQLKQFLDTSGSNCLFKESARTTTSEEFNHMPNLLPGQLMSADRMCEIIGGFGYRYVPFGDFRDKGACFWFVCVNEDKESPEYLRAKRTPAPVGFTCNDEALCVSQFLCQPWSSMTMSLKIKDFRRMREVSQWTEWPETFSECSRPCGTGMKIRERECPVKGFNLSPYCDGMRFQAMICNTDPCPGDPTSLHELRQARGDEVCARFLRNNVKLNLRKANAYLPTAAETIKSNEAGSNVQKAHSKTCMLKCNRDPIDAKGDLDGIMPDGSPCHDTERPEHDLFQYKINLRCAKGFCLEFTDCEDKLQKKDECGVCGGDGKRCFSKSFGVESDVEKGKRKTLATVPVGSEFIYAHLNGLTNIGVILELLDDDGNIIIGENGLHPEAYYNETTTTVPFAGTQWSYERHTAYLEAPGPINQRVVIKALRGAFPFENIQIKYTKPAQ